MATVVRKTLSASAGRFEQWHNGRLRWEKEGEQAVTMANCLALAVHRLQPDRAANLTSMLRLAKDAANRGATLVVFAETALTGFVATGDPAHDLPLGEPVPGPATEALADVARACRLWIGLGLYEREGDCLYDAAVLLAPDGTLALHYRRIDPHWHRPQHDPAIYQQGNAVPVADTPFGRCAFLLCGDLFNDEVLAMLKAAQPDLLLVPFARGFDTEVADAADWEQREQYRYADRVRQATVPALLVNTLASDPSTGAGFGGAMLIDAAGTIRRRLPLDQQGLLLVTLKQSGRA